jgi:hypothetical protein
MYGISICTTRDLRRSCFIDRISDNALEVTWEVWLGRARRTQVTAEEDARLVNLKEKEPWSWDVIEGAFPGRTRATLQVHYSMKLKDRGSALICDIN